MNMATALATTTPQINLAAIEKAGNLQDSTRTKYKREIERFLETGEALGDFDAVQEYAAGLSTSGRSFFK
ncbi:MAG: hypothetical protein GY862_30355, partial [Gammaproteobacteria bacterium]|nr:hypothetical protein [Gammaproteobacteria bacterium]